MGRRAVPEEEMKRRVNILISVLKEEDRNVYHDELNLYMMPLQSTKKTEVSNG